MGIIISQKGYSIRIPLHERVIKLSLLDWIMADAPVVKIKVVKEKRTREKKRKKDIPRYDRKASNPRRR